MLIKISTSGVLKRVLLSPSCVIKATYSSNNEIDPIFKFFSDEPGYENKDYKPLSAEDYKRFISVRSSKREPALTRQITALAYKVGKRMISLAEGMPNEDVFPFKRVAVEMKGGGEYVLEGKELAGALQYVPSQGLPSLLTELRQFQEDLHRPPPLPRDIMVINGGQHGIYQCMELLLEPGDPILLPEFAYTGLYTTLRPYQPEILGITEDDQGIIPENLEAILAERLSRGLKMPKLLYVIPTGSNPTGAVMSEERRRKVYELACRYDFLIVEDDPYMFLSYEDKSVPSFLNLDYCGRVIRLDSVSKVVSAGLRGAWVTAPKPLLDQMELHSQAEVLHSCTLSQTILLKLLSNREQLASHLHSARSFYRARRDALHAALRPLHGLADWAPPRGGLFIWIKIRHVHDVYNMVFNSCFSQGLMVVPGQAFQYDGRAPCQYIRLTFSKVKLEDMHTAATQLADIIRDEQANILQKRQAKDF